MPSPAPHQPPSAVDCEACRSAVRSDGRQSLSFLLLDQLTIPVLSCDEHLEQFSAVCELSTDGAAELLDHRPAGGLSCPGCRLASSESPHPLIRVRDGALVPLACSEHQSELVQRFQAGLEMKHRLTSGIETSTDPSL